MSFRATREILRATRNAAVDWWIGMQGKIMNLPRYGCALEDCNNVLGGYPRNLAFVACTGARRINCVQVLAKQLHNRHTHTVRVLLYCCRGVVCGVCFCCVWCVVCGSCWCGVL